MDSCYSANESSTFAFLPEEPTSFTSSTAALDKADGHILVVGFFVIPVFRHKLAPVSAFCTRQFLYDDVKKRPPY